MLNFYSGYRTGQRYVSWKASTKYSMQPKMQGPLANNSALTDPDGNANNVFPARRPGPIKHHRLRGSTQALADANDCVKCKGKLSITGSINDGNTNCPCSNDGKYGFQIKSASTLLGVVTDENGQKTIVPGKYATSNREYLQRRCKTFKQREFNYVGSNADAENNLYQANCGCNNTPSSCTEKTCRDTVYKRSNPGFSTQGAVSSGARIHRLKHETVANNHHKSNHKDFCCTADSATARYAKKITNDCTKRTNCSSGVTRAYIRGSYRVVSR